MKYGIIAAFLMLNMFASAQEKETISVEKFTWKSNVENSVGVAVREAVIGGLVNKGRFDIVDQEKNPTDEYKYQVTGNITAYVLNKETKTATVVGGGGGTKTYIQYSAKMQMSITASNKDDGKIIGTKTVEQTGMSQESYGDAMLDLLKAFDYDINSFVQDFFPLEVKIVEIPKEKKSKAKEVLIQVGSKFGTKNGDRFKIVELIDMNGVTRKKEIGKLSVTNVDDENFSVCKVLEGGAEILSAFNEGKKIICISIADSGLKKFTKTQSLIKFN